MAITKKQKEVYDYIQTYTHTNGYAPTQKEIKEHFGLKSFGSVQRYLKYLSDAGYIENDYQARRGIIVKQLEGNVSPSLSPMVASSYDIPLLGNIAAGNPIEAIENCDETISVPREMIKGKGKFFALKVNGESMINAGILNGDFAICKHQQTANNGEIVAAVIDGDATLKYYKQNKTSISLVPANENFRPIDVTSSNHLSIAGILVGLWRFY